MVARYLPALGFVARRSSRGGDYDLQVLEMAEHDDVNDFGIPEKKLFKCGQSGERGKIGDRRAPEIEALQRG